ncbi:uncharacterized protein BP01DRAFT_376414 [Aspergillus saccharolyticus JOP 1030-1]|uniref:DUF7732 domain-containing protein n=1 Tax=Aspergillus saccharolyticus JOP 1030-1 TaxID=1450539 RepID=A0A318Z543_9EURO|nr:hypothetical protein BP01DRAFT_376414 [Aspergillus saccharolyticus JOP 1030-1]PYH42179.1 hypothetical protein BP01DRAFT_376414 [Aspergillus saccharolyticus JOP 1030-1]
MKFTLFTALVVLLQISNTLSLSLPTVALGGTKSGPRHISEIEIAKRRGGGGGGGRAGGSSSGGGSGGRTGSSGGSSSSGSSSRTSSSTNDGGSTRSGSGSQPAYGGGKYYAGGATTPYTAGSRSRSGVTPYLVPATGLAFFGFWAYNVYAYPYPHHYYYVNQTSHRNESMPVVCLCQQYLECGCDDNSNSTYYESLFNGSQPTNTSITKVANVNGTESIYINGTLSNGTPVADSSASSTAAMGPKSQLKPVNGFWTIVALVMGLMWAL